MLTRTEVERQLQYHNQQYELILYKIEQNLTYQSKNYEKRDQSFREQLWYHTGCIHMLEDVLSGKSRN